jgi:hypothetical protein
MKLYFFTCLVFFCSLTLSAQQNKIFRINPGQKIVDVIPQSELYTYAQFTPGTILFKNGKYARVLLNYNVYNETVEFIDPKGDTLAVADENYIKMVTMQEDTFYYSKTYLKKIAQYGELLLAEKQLFSIANKEKIGAMGITTSASVETTSAFYLYNQKAKDLIVQEVLTIKKSNILFIGNKFHYFLPVIKKYLMEIYGKRQKEISYYLKVNSVHFSNEKDVKRLMEHLSK